MTIISFYGVVIVSSWNHTSPNWFSSLKAIAISGCCHSWTKKIKAIYLVASIASFISFHREYDQSEARNPLHTSAGCNGQYFKKISRRRLRPPHFPLKKEKGGVSVRQNFSFYQNFQMQVCKQYYKNRVNIHSNFLEVSDVKKVIPNEIKQTN